MFEIKTRVVNNVLIVDCLGRLVYGEPTERLALQVRDAMPEPPHVVLNLRGVTYIDSAGIGTLVGVYTSARSRGGDVRIASASAFIRSVLKITHLDTILPEFDDAETAAQSYKSSAA